MRPKWRRHTSKGFPGGLQATLGRRSVLGSFLEPFWTPPIRQNGELKLIPKSSTDLERYFWPFGGSGGRLGSFLELRGRFGVVCGAPGVVLGSLFEPLGTFWTILIPGRFQKRVDSMMATSFGPCWSDFGAVLDP